jgi:hypothetical protein
MWVSLIPDIVHVQSTASDYEADILTRVQLFRREAVLSKPVRAPLEDRRLRGPRSQCCRLRVLRPVTPFESTREPTRAYRQYGELA